jgi:hypothetical protein
MDNNIKYDRIYNDKFKKNLCDNDTFEEYLEINKDYLIESKNEKNMVTEDNHIIDYLVDLHNDILVLEASVGHNRKRNKIHAFISFSVPERFYCVICKTVENLFNRGLLKDYRVERIFSNDFEDAGMYVDRFTIYPSTAFPVKQRSFQHLKQVTDYIIDVMNDSKRDTIEEDDNDHN